MVETLVTASIIIVLLAIGMAGILRYRDYLRITELDNMARSIYMAAQNRAVLLDNDERFMTLVTKGTPQAGGDLGGGCGKITVSDSGEDKERWYIDSENSATAAALGELLPPGTIDPTLQNGRFYIVYEPGSASVTDVFYVEKQDYDLNKAFESEAAGKPGIVAALEKLGADDKRDARMTNKRPSDGSSNDKTVMVGWFGSNGAAGHDVEVGEPDVTVDIHNGDELVVIVTYKYTRLDGSPEVEAKTLVTLDYAGADSATLADYKGDLSGLNMSNPKWQLKFQGNVQDPVSNSTTYTYQYWRVLDSLKTGGDRFQDLSISGVSNYGNDFTVFATLQLYEKGNEENTSGTAKGDDTDNSLFATETRNGDTAYIANLRHLQNLDSDYSKAGGKTKAIQTANIDAEKASTLKKYNKDYEKCEYQKLEDDYEFKPIQNKDLLSYQALEDKDADKREDGTIVPFYIKDLNVTETSATNKNGAGLFGEVKNSGSAGFVFQDILLKNSKVAGGDRAAGGLVGKAEDVSLENCQASGVWITGNTVGGLAGSTEAAGFVNCIVAEDSPKDDKFKENEIKGIICAGGMVGNSTGVCLFEGCQISGTVSGTAKGTQVTGINEESIAGGLAGSTKGARFGPYTAEDGAVKNCTAKGVTVTGERYAGGLVGYNEGGYNKDGYNKDESIRFENCQVSLVRVKSKDGIAGGIAGADKSTEKEEKVVFKKCEIENLKVESTNSSAGGMLGCKSQGSVTFDSCTIQKNGSGNIADNDELKGIDVDGGSNAGGLLGYTDYEVTDKGEKKYNATASFTKCTVGKANDASTITVDSSTMYAGGLAGDSAGGLFENCRVYSASVEGSRAGGLAGNTSADKFTDCIVGESGKVTVKAAMYAGGLAGTSNVGPFLNCRVVNAEVTCSAAGSMAGGLAGDTGATKFNGCTVGNSGEVTVSSVRIAGGLAGNNWGNTSFENCQVASATVSCNGAGDYAGGISGFNWDGTVSFKSCTVESLKVRGSAYVGGLMGCKSAGSVTFDSCEVKKVTIADENNAGGDNVGGLLGATDGSACTAIFMHCTVGENGSITLKGNVTAGGLVGNTESSAPVYYGDCHVKNISVEALGYRRYAGGLAGKTKGDIFGKYKDKDGKEVEEICTVENATVNVKDSQGYVGGLTGFSEYGSFSGCTVTGGSVTADYDSHIGGLTGRAMNIDKFSNCHVNNTTIAAKSDATWVPSIAGGLAGSTEGSIFEGCSASWDLGTQNTVTATSYAGGLTGNAVGGSFSGCTVTGAVVVTTGTREVWNDPLTSVTGGLAGHVEGGSTLSNCKVIDARVKAASYAGGLLGEMINSTLTGCQVYLENDIGSMTDYRVKAESFSGGLVGIITGNGSIQQSFAATLVQGTTNAGGLVGALSVPKDDKGNPLPGAQAQVNIGTSYADCYLAAGGGTDAPYAGGLVGSKEVLVDLIMNNVYAAGFIAMEKNIPIEPDKEGRTTAAGLCSGYASTKDDKSDANPAKVTNAYAAMHYTNVDDIQPLADGVAASDAQKCYYLKFKGDTVKAGTAYAQMANLSLNAPFKQPPCESHPYNIYVLNNEVRSAYPFLWLEGLPHYGDWVTQNMANEINVLNEEPEAVSDDVASAVSDKDLPDETKNPDAAPDEELPPADGEAPKEEENSGTEETENPDEAPENNNVSPQQQPEAVVPSEVRDDAEDEGSPGDGDSVAEGGDTP